MPQSPEAGGARRPVLSVDEPVQQVVVLATGLTAVAGSTAWQVLWLLTGVVTVLVARAGRARAAATAALS